METNKITFLSQTKEVVRNIFNISCDELIITTFDKYFILEYNFQNLLITIETNSNRYENNNDYYDILIDKKGYLTTYFSYLYPYYENKPFNCKFNIKLLANYLNKLKEYIENNKLYFIEINLKDGMRVLHFNNTVKKIPSISSWDKEPFYIFGEDGKRILDNPPIYQ